MRRVNVYLNINKVDDSEAIAFIDNYNGSVSALFKDALREFISQTRLNSEPKIVTVETPLETVTNSEPELVTIDKPQETVTNEDTNSVIKVSAPPVSKLMNEFGL